MSSNQLGTSKKCRGSHRKRPSVFEGEEDVQESTVSPHFFDLCTKKGGKWGSKHSWNGVFWALPEWTHWQRTPRAAFLVVPDRWGSKNGFFRGGRSKRSFPTHGKKAPTSGLVENFTPRGVWTVRHSKFEFFFSFFCPFFLAPFQLCVENGPLTTMATH